MLTCRAGGGQARNAGGFQTDSQISGQGYIERELTAWAPSADDATFGALGGGQQQGQWDQFQANRDLYGVKDTYDETLYTTKLDSKKFTSEQRAHAAKMAREIERQSSGNIHMQEERNQVPTVADCAMSLNTLYLRRNSRLILLRWTRRIGMVQLSVQGAQSSKEAGAQQMETGGQNQVVATNHQGYRPT